MMDVRSLNIAPGSASPLPHSHKSRIRIEEIGCGVEEEEEEQVYSRLNRLVSEYSHELDKKEGELRRMKELLCSYEGVIEELQREKSGNPYQSRGREGHVQHYPVRGQPS